MNWERQGVKVVFTVFAICIALVVVTAGLGALFPAPGRSGWMNAALVVALCAVAGLGGLCIVLAVILEFVSNIRGRDMWKSLGEK